ncbi:MAG: hypothetical protein WEE66_05665 [Actinomycetota bacterium]
MNQAVIAHLPRPIRDERCDPARLRVVDLDVLANYTTYATWKVGTRGS